MQKGAVNITADRERRYVFIENRTDRTVTVDLKDIVGGLISVPPENVFRHIPQDFGFRFPPSGGLEAIDTSLCADRAITRDGMVILLTDDWRLVRAERSDGKPVDLAAVLESIEQERKHPLLGE